MGTGDSLQDLRDLAAKLQLNGCVELPGFVSDEDLQANLAAADICVDPDPSSPLNDVSTWIKVMEYMAYGKADCRFRSEGNTLFCWRRCHLCSSLTRKPNSRKPLPS